MTPTPVPRTPIDIASEALIAFRNKPLLVMYYPPRAQITDLDISDTYREMRRGGATKETQLQDLDILLHTFGGDPVAAYRIAQVIRSGTKHMTALVPENAYSAGTLLSFSANAIRLGDFAGLSPIDITVVEKKTPEGVQLAAVDSFRDFSKDCRRMIEHQLEEMGRKNASTCVDSDLLVQMVKEVGALTIGRYYRERKLTGEYAQILLDRYMFADVSNGQDMRNGVISHFLFGAPAHNFHLDYHLCKSWHLKVQRMATPESDLANGVVAALDDMAGNGVICRELNHYMRMPFIQFYAAPTQQPRTRTRRR